MSARLLETSVLADGDCPADWQRQDLLEYAQWAAGELTKRKEIPNAKALARCGRADLLRLLEWMRL